MNRQVILDQAALMAQRQRLVLLSGNKTADAWTSPHLLENLQDKLAQELLITEARQLKSMLLEYFRTTPIHKPVVTLYHQNRIVLANSELIKILEVQEGRTEASTLSPPLKRLYDRLISEENP